MSADTPWTCPLCDRECKHRNHLREHLHEEHRKSEIVDRLLDHYEC
jgi:hypothetical protein